MRRQDVKLCKEWGEPAELIPKPAPNYHDRYIKVERVVDKAGEDVQYDILYHLLHLNDFFHGGYKDLIPDDPKKNPELCLAVAKTIQRYSHPDMGGTDEQAQLANKAYQLLKKELE